MQADRNVEAWATFRLQRTHSLRLSLSIAWFPSTRATQEQLRWLPLILRWYRCGGFDGG